MIKFVSLNSINPIRNHFELFSTTSVTLKYHNISMYFQHSLMSANQLIFLDSKGCVIIIYSQLCVLFTFSIKTKKLNVVVTSYLLKRRNLIISVENGALRGQTFGGQK